MQDRGASLSSRLVEPHTRAEFDGEGDRGRKGVGGIGRKSGSLGLWDSRERQSWLLRWSLEAPSTENWVEALDAEAVMCTLWVGWEVETEIPDKE